MSLSLPLNIRVNPAGGEHGVQGKGNKEGDENRKGHGDPELEEKPTHDPFHKGHRNEDRHNGESGGQHGQPDFTRSFPCRLEVVLSALEVANDIFPDDNGIIDEQSDGKGEGHQGHHIQCHSQEVHDDEGGDDRDGKGQPCDHRGTPGIEEAGRR